MVGQTIIPSLFFYFVHLISLPFLTKYNLISTVDGPKPGSGQILRSIKILKVIFNGRMQNLGVFYGLQVLLRYVGYLRCWSVSGVHQDCVVGLVPPLRLLFMHLFQPVLWSPGPLVPANDDSPVAPALVLDNLAHSEGDVGRPSCSRFDALSEISVFVSKHENLFSRTFTVGVIQTVRIENIFYIERNYSL